MNEGLVATIALDDNLESNYQLETPLECFEQTYYLPPDFAFVGIMNSEPKTLDEALRGPQAKEWQKALEYEINQLEKLRTWIEIGRAHV